MAELTKDQVFTVLPDVADRFAKEIEILNHTLKSYPYPALFPIPPLYSALDGVRPGLVFESGYFALDRDTLKKITGQWQSKQDEAHQMRLEDVKRLPQLMADPLLIVRDSDKSIVAIIDLEDNRGHGYCAVVHIDKWLKNRKVNEIASVYSRSNLVNWLGYNRLDNKKGLEKDLLYYREEGRESTLQSQTNVSLNSLLGVGAPQSFTASRAFGSIPTGQRVLNSTDIVNILNERNKQPIIDLTGLCPREAGRKLFEATQGDLSNFPLIRASAAAAGLKINLKRLEGVKDKNPALPQERLLIKEALMQALSPDLSAQHHVKSRDINQDKEK